MTLRHRIRFYQQLAVLARAGVPLRTSLDRLKERLRGGEVVRLAQHINAGEPVGAAFAQAGFSPLECHLVTAGERSARLEIVYQHLADFWDRQRQLLQALVSQLYYPLIVLHLSIAMSALVDLVTGSATRAAVDLAENLVLLYGGALAVYLLIRLTWNTRGAQRFWLCVPFIGKTLRAAYAYRWITALRIEYSAGIPLPDAVADAWLASGFAEGPVWAEEGRTALLGGSELAPLLPRWTRLPADWIDLVETGEVSGTLEAALENLDAEAGRSWTLAQAQMTELLPKALYIVILLVTAVQIFSMLYQVTTGSADEVLKQIEILNQ